MIIGCATLILWWPLWWTGRVLTATNISYAPIWKACFYANLFSMWISWVILYLVLKKGMRLEDDEIWREVLKSLCFLAIMLLLMDLPLMISML